MVSMLMIHHSNLGNNCTIKEASVFSCHLSNEVQLLQEVILFSTQLENNIHIGNRTAISNSSIGKYTYLAGNNRVFNTTIGAFCSIAENATIGHAEHPYNQFSTSPVFYKKDNALGTKKFYQQTIDEFTTTTIGHDVWIGYNAYIRSGITVGNGSIIGAGAVVTKNVEPYTIVAGVPAKKIRDRFNAGKIQQLEQDKWWNLADEELIVYAEKNFSTADRI
ncbi:MAG: CatB-related O-acetyltransferase [Sphingobacteriaceae bacterium]|nr:MAG: CatB-related O-acetyltransferase [Sphingobacteriaceae bacterium]